MMLMKWVTWINNYSGMLNCVITIVYVIATILILRANQGSMNAAKEQLEESKRQHVENQRLENMPFLQIEKTNSSSDANVMLDFTGGSPSIYSIVINIKNVGNGTASNIICSWKEAKEEPTDPVIPSFNAIMKADSYACHMKIRPQHRDNDKCILELDYNDLLGNTYVQKIIFGFENDKLVYLENDMPQYQGVVKYSLKKDQEVSHV